VLLARGRERLEATAAEIGAEAEVCDVADREQVTEAARRVGEDRKSVV
jgi:NADP-dependent 3-hydroxy acid dehydrogenase YdfG